MTPSAPLVLPAVPAWFRCQRGTAAHLGAFDPRDRFHERSAAFLRALAAKGVRLHGPAFVLTEELDPDRL